MLCREPFDLAVRRILLACKQGEVVGCIAAHSISNMFFMLRKAFSVEERKNILKNVCELFEVEGIDKEKYCLHWQMRGFLTLRIEPVIRQLICTINLKLWNGRRRKV